MIADRALAGRTIDRYEKTARRFLVERSGALGQGAGAEAVTAAEVTTFLLSEVSRGLARGSLQGRVGKLRSLLRFLYLKGFTGHGSGAGGAAAAGWKDGVAHIQAMMVTARKDTTTDGGRG